MAHLNYYIDLCAEAYIVNGDAVLLRLHEKYDLWASPGGHIDPGEDPNEAVIREVWEEVGLKIELVGPTGWTRFDTETNADLVPPVFINRHAINATHDHASLIFIARSASREIEPQTKADKGAVCVWVTREQLDEMKEKDARLRKEVYRYASTALTLVTQ